MAKAKRSIAKSGFVEKNLETALERLEVAATAGGKALAARARDGKKVTIAVKRLSKRRGSLLKRKKVAARRARKSPSGETRRALKATVRELASTTAALAKAKLAKTTTLTELAALRVAARRASGYVRAIAAVDRGLRRK